MKRRSFLKALAAVPLAGKTIAANVIEEGSPASGESRQAPREEADELDARMKHAGCVVTPYILDRDVNTGTIVWDHDRDAPIGIASHDAKAGEWVEMVVAGHFGVQG